MLKPGKNTTYITKYTFLSIDVRSVVTERLFIFTERPQMVHSVPFSCMILFYSASFVAFLSGLYVSKRRNYQPISLTFMFIHVL